MMLAILSYLICAIFCMYNFVKNDYSLIWYLFFIAVLFSMLYEHGYKLFLRRGGVFLFFIVYIIPFLLVLSIFFLKQFNYLQST